MQDLGVECDRLKVRRHVATSETPPLLIVAGAVGILGLMLAAATTTSSIPITTGILSNRIIAVKPQLSQ